jgi:hypothetical protein
MEEFDPKRQKSATDRCSAPSRARAHPIGWRQIRILQSKGWKIVPTIATECSLRVDELATRTLHDPGASVSNPGAGIRGVSDVTHRTRHCQPSYLNVRIVGPP